MLSFEVSDIKCNGVMGRSLLVEDGGDESGGVDQMTFRIPADMGRRMRGNLTDGGEREML